MLISRLIARVLASKPAHFSAIATLLVLFAALAAHGQGVPNQLNTGYPENSIFHGSEIDNVQLENGNLHVAIPIWSARGRGLNTGFNFVYDNHGYKFITHCYTGGGGFCQDVVATDPLSPRALKGFGPLDYQFGTPQGGSVNCSGPTIFTMSGLFLREPDGTKHHFSPDPVATNIDGCGYVVQSTVYADDGSGWIMQLDLANEVPAYATNRKGTKVLYSPGVVTDANGNQISWNSSQQVTDTLGRVVLGSSYYDSSGTLQSPSVTTTNGVITQISLPNNHGTYTFTYAPTIPTQICQFSNADQCIESSGGGGEIAGITLPTGGQISYTWGTWDAGGRRVASRTVSANGVTGTWNYQYVTDASATVTDASGRDMKLASSGGPCGNNSKTLQYFDGSAVSGPLIKTVQTDYNGNLAAIQGGITACIPLPIRVTTTWNQQNLVSKVETDWDIKSVTPGTSTFTWKNPIERREYDWGTGAPGPLLRRSHYNYLHLQNSAYFNQNIADRPTSVIVYDGASKIMAQTTNTYDGSAVQATSGAPGHDYTNHGSANNVRGNLTQVSRWLNPGGTWQNTTNTFNDLGDLLSATDPRNNTTSFSYADNFTDVINRNSQAFVTQTTYPPTNGVSHIERKQYYWNTSLPAASCGQNFPAASACTNTASIPQPDYTSYTYDLMNRSLNVTRGDGGQTNFSYNDSAQPLSISSTQFISGSSSLLAKTTLLDGMGRTKQSQLTSDPQGTVFTDTTYDAFGRVSTVFNPYRSTGDSTYGNTTYNYDALGRTTKVIPPDGSTSTNNVSTSYSGNTITVTDQAGKSRKSIADGLGRITQVFEDPAGFNYETDYQYDALSNLLSVNQKGGSTNSANWRTRTFTYNSLSQLLTASNPESGTTTYAYDNNGNVISTTDARGITTCFGDWTGTTCNGTTGYDALNRLLKKTYSDGTTPSANFVYDTAAGWQNPAVTQTNLVGRLSLTLLGSEPQAEQVFSYDAVGRANANNQCTPLNCHVGSFTMNYTYDLAGNMVTFTDGVGETYTQTLDAASRVTQLNSSWVDFEHPAIMASGISYSPAGAITKMTYGNGLTETDVYNSRLQPCRFGVNSSGTSLVNCTDAVPGGNFLDLAYGFNSGTSNNGNIASWTAVGQQSFNRSYTYDSLNRIATMADSNGGQSCRGLSWTIDPWANRTDQTVTVGTCNTFHQIVDTQNRLVGPPYQYDAAGNMTNDGSHTYTYDAENRLISVDGGATASYLYDAQGRRVRKSVGAAQTHYIYDLSGNVISELDQNSVWKNVYLRLDGKLFAQYTIGSPRTQFVHTDHLGSTRLLTGMTQSVVDSLDYLPYGEQIAGGSGTTHKFTGKERDSESGLDNFGARYDSSSMGRFMSPDPMGGHQKDPQTMNRYAYVRNNPLNLTDPTGLDFYLQCRDEKHNGCTQVQIDPKNDNQTWVQADKDGNATVITSDSIRDKENTATVDENGVQINGSQGIYFDNPASHTTDASGQDDNHNSIVLTGSGKLTDFNITINGNCSGTCLSSGTWSFPQGSWDNARETLNVRGSFYFPGEDLRAATGSGQHPYTTQHRFGGANCQMLTSCNNSPHLSVPYDPKRNVPQGFHVDAHGDMYHHNQDVSRQGVE